MSERTGYITKQKKELSDYLKSVSGRHVTVNDICEHFKNEGNPIGMTTIYRQLDRLIEEGLVNKYIVDKNSPACFEYISNDTHDHEHVCFHCKCESCGKLIHLHCDELEKIKSHLLADHDFVLNPLKTVFYGICSECRANAGGVR